MIEKSIVSDIGGFGIPNTVVVSNLLQKLVVHLS